MKLGALLLLALTVGCGGSQTRRHDPHAAERARIQALEPARPYEVRSIRGYRAPDTCGQGPYRIELAAVGAGYGEQLEVNLCAPRSLQGDYRLTVGTERREPRHFGSRNNSDHCLPTASERTAAVRAGGGSSGVTSSSRDAGTPPASAGAASAAATALVAVTHEVGETCPEGTYLTGIVDYSIEGSDADPPWQPGLGLVLELWSSEPLHLDGAVFVVIQRGVRADMTVERWTTYQREREDWVKLWNAFLEGEVTAGRTRYADFSAHTTDAPPPPRLEVKPPKPSTHAAWIAGYWQRDREWIWSPGFWRVPESDIVAEETVEAPVAPPPAKVEAPAVKPASVSVTMVWTPGYWAWNGSAYIWIAGAWRIPPQGTAQWVAPSWTPRRGRMVLVPGGWSIRIGR